MTKGLNKTLNITYGITVGLFLFYYVIQRKFAVEMKRKKKIREVQERKISKTKGLYLNGSERTHQD